MRPHRYARCMKVNRDMVAVAGLKLLNEVGLEQLTLRLLAKELKIQAPTVYWHFKSKEELIDEMSSMVLAQGAWQLVPAKESADWNAWAAVSEVDSARHCWLIVMAQEWSPEAA